MTDNVYLNDLGIINAIGRGKSRVHSGMLAGHAPGMCQITTSITGRIFYAGQVLEPLPSIPAEFSIISSRNTQLILAALQEIESAIVAAIEKYSAQRIGVVVGTSTSGVAETEEAIAALRKSGSLPKNYFYQQQEAAAGAEFIADYLKLDGPVYTISTACSSSGKIFASARGLITLGLCDAVIVGGADSLCELTLNGFKSLEAISDECCNPFSINRKGINIGEAAAVFLMSREARGVRVCGIGESSDAYHMSAPEPSGDGARQAMLAALQDAALQADSINYINLHGTGTRLNDLMESHAVFSVFGDKAPASSSKPLTGHTLGAAGATEAGLCWLLLTDSDTHHVIPHIYDGRYDSECSKIMLCEATVSESPLDYAMSNSFAFGGNNVSLILGRLHNA